MSNRVTEKDLQNIVDRINRMTISPMAPYVKDTEGKFKAQIGNYHLDHAYGGVSLRRMCNTSGGESDVLMIGHAPKRELQSAMWAYIRGLEDAQTRTE
jgi:hypothetical protein